MLKNISIKYVALIQMMFIVLDHGGQCAVQNAQYKKLSFL